MIRPLLPFSLFSAASLMVAAAQDPLVVPPEIVGGWKLDGAELVVTFLFDGSFYLVDGQGARPGMERGFFIVDEGALHAEVLLDTNGEAGLSHPAGAASVSITGDTLTYTVVGEGSFTFSRVTHATRPEVGSWFIPAEKCMLTLLADGTYYHCQEMNDAPDGHDGIERGTYAWNTATESFTGSPVVDTNGYTGLSDQQPYVRMRISGNGMAMLEGPDQHFVQDQFLFQRIQANPGLSIDNDYEVNRFIFHTQDSPGAPLADGYGAAAYLHGISGSGGTLTIGSQPPRPFDGDDFEQQFPTRTALEGSAGFPDGTNHVVQRPGGSATLVFPPGSGSAYANAPAVTGNGGTWSGGIYQLSRGDLLEWTRFDNYNPATDVTVITVAEEGEEDEYLYEHAMQGDVTSFDFTGRLEPGTTYQVTVEHVRLASTTSSGTGPFAGKLGYVILGSHTAFAMRTYSHTPTAPPVISEPVTMKTVNAGSVIFTVAAADGNATYQWQQDGWSLDGQTGNSLALHDITADDYGTYRVRVTNGAGSVTSNAVTLSSLPAAPEITVSQPSDIILSAGWSRAFGTVALGGGADLVFTVRNTGTLHLMDLEADIHGTHADDFSVAQAPATNVTPGGSTTFTVRFSPSSSGAKEAVLFLRSNDGDENPFRVMLSGVAEDPVTQPLPPAAPVVNPSTGVAEQTVTVNNTGTSGMGGLQLRIDGVPDGVTVVGGTYVGSSSPSGGRTPKAAGGYWLVDHSAVIGAGGSADIVVRYEFTGAPVAFTPTVAVAPVQPPGPADPAFQQALKSISASPGEGRSTIGLRAVPGRVYEVWHSNNLTVWQRAGTSIFSRATALAWTDDGSATGTPPSTSQPRFYRVVDVTE
ncbi:choice-of-anchor D domain-containing protein [Luteolibacter sp. SL250]|uniref:choice-of-anchor D domain-containing protein n=1 Tax=Luteolibacter sp. SL250 TaxID=2995170 RepID=UPI00226F7DE4|nr:choice-of-anchor D domain-containing protein [Luteolibacter sp. SL250]WAC19132.1 choice-of-anchor D domain-containing protein [Luteolibacter sp. SL250]